MLSYILLFRVTLLTNFDFYLCLRVKFHKSLVWVPILAAGGPYWVPISPKKLVPIGSVFQSLGVPICFRHSAYIFRTFGGASSKRYPVLHHTFPTRNHSHFSWFPGSFRWVFDIYATQICICSILLPIIHI